MGNVTKLPAKAEAPAEDQLDGFETKTITVRGNTYKFRELSATEYDDAVGKATKDGENSPDMVQLLRWMIIKGSVEPKIDFVALGKLPFGVVGKISDAVNELHFGPPDLTPLADRLEAFGWKVEPPAPVEAEEAPKGS